MTDADLTTRLDRIDGRLDRMVAVLDAQTKLILALDARMESGFAALNGRVGRLSETLMRGFTWRDEQMQEILARVEALEERIQSEGSR
jgi:hypothetical protein